MSDNYLYIWMRRRTDIHGPWTGPRSGWVARGGELPELQYAMESHIYAADPNDGPWEDAIFRVPIDALERVEVTGDDDDEIEGQSQA